MDKKTLDFYNNNADKYFSETKSTFVCDSLESFISYIPYGGYILDCGCGSGRDSLYFLEHGYRVDGIEKSHNLAQKASLYIGQNVIEKDYLLLNEKEKYDGIWAQASLLHNTKEDLTLAFNVLTKALKKNGYFYASFRYGIDEKREGERWYINMTEEKIKNFIPSSLVLIKVWLSNDVRENYNYRWINFIFKKL